MTQDRLTDVYEFIYKIDKRVNTLEKDTAFVESKIQSVTLLGKQKYSLLHYELDELKHISEELRSDLNKFQTLMMQASKDLKFTVKKDQIAQLTATVDNVPFEEFLTREELKRML